MFKKGQLLTIVNKKLPLGCYSRVKIFEFLFSEKPNPLVTLIYLKELEKKYEPEPILISRSNSIDVYDLDDWNFYEYKGIFKCQPSKKESN